MVPMFECTKSYKLCRAKNHKFGDKTTVVPENVRYSAEMRRFLALT